jgi:hypothetical protein
MADEQTASQPTPAAHPDFAKPPAQPGEQRVAPAAAKEAPAATAQTVPFTLDQVQRFVSLERELNEIKAAKQAELDAKEQERILALAKAGDSEKALEETRKIGQQREADALKKYKDLEAIVFDEKTDATLSSALNGCVFAGQDDAARSSAAKMLKTILRGDIEAVRDSATGSVVVRDKASGRPAADVLRERLSDPTLAFFFAPTTRGGSGGDGTRTPATKDAPQSGSLEAIAAQYKTAQGQYSAIGLGPRV